LKRGKGAVGQLKEAGEKARKAHRITAGMSEKQMVDFHKKMVLLRERKRGELAVYPLEDRLSVKRIDMKETNLKSLERIYSAKPGAKKYDTSEKTMLSSEDGDVMRFGKRPQTGVGLHKRLQHKPNFDRNPLAQALEVDSERMNTNGFQSRKMLQTSTEDITRKVLPSSLESDTIQHEPVRYLHNSPIVFNPSVAFNKPQTNRRHHQLIINNSRPLLAHNRSPSKFNEYQKELKTIVLKRVSRQGPRVTTELRPRDTGSFKDTEENRKKSFQGFEIGKRIGKGAYASVFMATEIKSHLIYALKTYEKPALDSKTRRTIVDREIEILRFVKHPNLISLHRVLDSKSHVRRV
jgi:hypothetical protein